MLAAGSAGFSATRALLEELAALAAAEVSAGLAAGACAGLSTWLWGGFAALSGLAAGAASGFLPPAGSTFFASRSMVTGLRRDEDDRGEPDEDGFRANRLSRVTIGAERAGFGHPRFQATGSGYGISVNKN